MTANNSTGVQESELVTAAQPDQHRHGTGRAADDDVLGAAPLQPQRVDDDVERGRRHGQHGGEKVDRRRQTTNAAASRTTAKTWRRRGRHLAGHERPVLGPLHHRVDVAVDHHVDGVRPPAGQRAADQRGHDEPTAGSPAATIMVGTVVTSSSSMIRGLVSATYPRSTSTGVWTPRWLEWSSAEF